MEPQKVSLNYLLMLSFERLLEQCANQTPSRYKGAREQPSMTLTPDKDATAFLLLKGVVEARWKERLSKSAKGGLEGRFMAVVDGHETWVQVEVSAEQIKLTAIV